MSLIDLMARRRALALVCLAGVLGVPARAAAQTLFAWPDTAVDVASYQTIEECQGAITRSLTSATTRENFTTRVWRDTLPTTDAGQLSGPPPLPASVVATARRCGARFAGADTITLTDFAGLLPLYLQAGWDDKASTLIRRRLAKVGAKNDAERAAVLDTAFDDLAVRKSVQPFGVRRVALAETLMTTELPRITDRLKRLQLYVGMGLPWIAAGDTNADSASAGVARITATMAAILDSLTPHELDELKDQFGVFTAGVESKEGFAQRYYAMLNMALGHRTVLDSLRRSTAAYLKLLQANWTKATGMRGEAYEFGKPVGEHAPPLQATLWRGYDPAHGPRPTPGRIALVLFLDPHACKGVPKQPYDMRDTCAGDLTALHRLEQRYPELETTIVAPSAGYFLYQKDGVTPEREAELTKQWVESFGVRAAVAMDVADARRYPAPDGRRIPRPWSDQLAYGFGKRYTVENHTAFLIDEAGIIIQVGQLHGFSLGEGFDERVQILFERQQRAAR